MEVACYLQYKFNVGTISDFLTCIYLFNKLSATSLRSIFKRILPGFNSEFSFSQTGCHTKSKEPSLIYCFTHSGKENSSMHTFPKRITSMRTANRLILV